MISQQAQAVVYLERSSATAWRSTHAAVISSALVTRGYGENVTRAIEHLEQQILKIWVDVLR